MADTTPQDPPAQDVPSPPSRRLGHWIKTVSAAIIGLGAVLAAIAGILDLVQKDPAAAAGVSFEQLELNAISLSDFQQTQKFSAAGLPVVHARLTSATLAQAGTDATITPDPQECPTADEIAQGAAVPEGCPTAGTDGSTETDQSNGTDESTGTEDPGAAAAELGEQYDMGRGCDGDPAGGDCALNAIAKSAAPAQGVSPERKIDRVRRVLAGTRSQIVDGKRLPMGMMVSVDVTVTGMAGQPIDVYWSVLSADTSRALAQSWLRNTRAATLHPRAQEAQLEADLWLPLPRERGRYRARITLVDEAGEHYSERTAVFH